MSKFSENGAMIRERIVSSALGALANSAAVIVNGLTLQEDFRLLKSEMFVNITALTGGEASGLIFGIANGELTIAEIEEAIEANGPLDLNDRLLKERATRNVKLLAGQGTDRAESTQERFVNDEGGPKIVSKHRWTYSNPEGWNYFVYNTGGSLTTGGLLHVTATHFGLWLV